MSSYNKPSIIDEINSFGECDLAFFTTFNFDISFFDRTILPILAKRKPKICIFVDSKQFQESIKENNISASIGKYYFVQPFRMEKAFHPKIILLLGKNKAKVIISSANLTYSSHFYNNELFQSYSYDESNKEFLGLFIETFTFFKQLSSIVKQDYINNLLEYISTKYSFLLKEQSRNFPLLLTSYSNCLLTSISEIIDEKVEYIRVAVPFYDQNLSALIAMKKRFADAKISLYIQDTYSTFPKYNYSPNLIDNTKIFTTVHNNGNEQKQFYHGKIFDFVCKTKEYVLFGSPNFSASAFLNSYTNSGNIEACILDIVPKGSLNDLFDCFLLENIDIKNLSTIPEAYDTPPETTDFSFINGAIKNSNVKVTICSKNIKPKQIKIDGIIFEKFTIDELNEDKYLISFDNILNKNIFDLEISDGDLTATIKCFVSNIDYLLSYINSSVKNPFKNVKSDADIKNINKEEFLKKLLDILSDIRLGIQEQDMLKKSSLREVNDDTEEKETDEDDATLSYSLYESPDYVITIGDNQIYKTAMRYLTINVENVSMLLNKKRKTKNIFDKGNNENEETEKKDPKQFSTNILLNYFKRYASLKNTAFNGLNFDFYFGLYEVFTETFSKDLYLYKNHEIDIQKMAEIKIDYLNNRIFPSLKNDDLLKPEFNYLKKEIALLCLEIHSANPINIHDFKKELINLDIRFDNAFIDEIETLMLDVGNTLEIENIESKIQDFKELIMGYPKQEEVFNLLRIHFNFSSSNSEVKIENGDTIHFLLSDQSVNRWFNGRLDLTNDLRDKIYKFVARYYSKTEQKIAKYCISIKKYTQAIEKVSFFWDDINYKKYQYIIEYNNKQASQTKYTGEFAD